MNEGRAISRHCAVGLTGVYSVRRAEQYVNIQDVWSKPKLQNTEICCSRKRREKRVNGKEPALTENTVEISDACTKRKKVTVVVIISDCNQRTSVLYRLSLLLLIGRTQNRTIRAIATGRQLKLR